MSVYQVSYEAEWPQGASSCLMPGGLATPHGIVTAIEGEGEMRPLAEANGGQPCWVFEGARMALTITFDEAKTGAYPDAMFTFRENRYTRFADALIAEAEEAAKGKTGVARATAIACAAAERFTYGHPEAGISEGLDEVPALGCGLTEGSCVDINTYFIAALRAAGIEAGYATGFFFPEEKGGAAEDGHCWVVTRIGGETQEWDIAHHLKMGTRVIAPGLNPKPGYRVPWGHSMGLSFPEFDIVDLKALIEPIPLSLTAYKFETPTIRLSRFAA